MMVEHTAGSMADHLACLCVHMRFFLAQAVRASQNDPDRLDAVETMTDLIATGLVGILCADGQAQEHPGLTIADLFTAFQPPA